jgi:peptidoglycan/xylan/chitin deacetylase (PgdA/CDA1 family)
LDFTHARYREVLRAGRQAGYRFASFGEIPAVRRSTERVCLLRHDCDNDLAAAADLAKIEAEEAVRSTFFVMLRSALYNALAPTNAALIHAILERGHRLGLHFDESVVADQPDETVVVRVDRERRLLAEEFGTEIDVVSFHQPSRRVLDGRLKLNCLNTYDRQDMDRFYYSSDSNLTFRSGDPLELFRTGAERKLHLLLHPEWWTSSAMPLDAKWDRMLSNNLQLMQESILAREDTYNTRRRWTITPDMED